MTVAVSALLPAAVVLRRRVAEVTSLPAETIGMSVITIAMTVTMNAATAIMSAATGMAIVGTVSANALVTVRAALKTETAMRRKIGNGAMMIGSAARMSGKMFQMAKTGKVRSSQATLKLLNPPPPTKPSAYHPQYPWTPFLLLMMSLILLSRSAQSQAVSNLFAHRCSYSRVGLDYHNWDVGIVLLLQPKAPWSWLSPHCDFAMSIP